MSAATVPNQTMGKLPFTEKLGYSLADGAAQFVFLTMVNFQSGFYTDAMGLNPNTAGWLVLIARLWDAFFDPMMGIIADRTKTRWGRFRPWILWSSIPWAIAMVAAYYVPGFKANWATFAYALITNIALMTIYSMNNTPYSALMAVMTGNQKERTSVSQYRFIVAMIGQLIVGGFTLVIMNALGGPLAPPPTELANQQRTVMVAAATQPGTKLPFEVAPEVAAKIATLQQAAAQPGVKPTVKIELADTPAMREYKPLKAEHDAKGWPLTMAIYAGICVVCFLITFATTKERITPIQKKRSPIGKDISTLVRVGPWIVMFIVTLSHYILGGMRGPSYQYYLQYVSEPQALRLFLDTWHLPVFKPNPDLSQVGVLSRFMYYSKLVIIDNNSNVFAVTYGLLQMTNKIFNVLGILSAGFLVAKFSKKSVVTLGCALNSVSIFALFIIPPNNLWTIFITEWFGQLAYGPCMALLWVLFADVCDYAEWKTGRSMAGFIYSTFFFALKAGNSLGASLGMWILGAFGYQANVTQDDRSKWGILLTFSLIPGIISIARVGSMLIYPITKKMNNDISEELAQRRAAAAAAEPKKA
jgi:Na+/melibiose symporter-like transporter